MRLTVRGITVLVLINTTAVLILSAVAFHMMSGRVDLNGDNFTRHYYGRHSSSYSSYYHYSPKPKATYTRNFYYRTNH